MIIDVIKWKIWRRIYKFYEIDTLRRSRNKFATGYLQQKNGLNKRILSKEWDEIKAFWTPYFNVSNKKAWFEYYHALDDNNNRLKYYIPDDIYFMYIDLFFSHARKAMCVDDKNLYDLLFFDVKMPKTIIRKSEGIYMDDMYEIISEEQAVKKVTANLNVICKPPVLSEGGHGIRFWNFQEESADSFRKWLHNNSSMIIQEIVSQHPSLAAIHKDSINTIRIMTIIINDTVRVVSSVLRMGVNGAKVDNASSGGIVCGIKSDGSLRNRALDTKGNIYYCHPQGGNFEGIVISGYQKCCEEACRLAPRLAQITKLVSWDFSVSEDETPILIEANLSYGGIGIHQMCNGPLFGDSTEEILKIVFNKNE